MGRRRPYLLVLFGCLASLGAGFRTANFLVEAPTEAIAQQVGQAAEYYRREKALEWLGQEMPPWPEPCPLRVKVTMSGAGGATSFYFDRGRVLGQTMTVEGTLERILASVLPHEVTHTVFAHYFRCAVPRWADEGGSVLSEDELERNRHDQLVRQILNAGRAIPLRRLFVLQQYPSDVMTLYAQGYSVANFLVGCSNRQVFLGFVAHGMRHGWDSAVQTHYSFRTVDELEQAWLQHLRSTRRQPPTILAHNTTPPSVDPAKRVVVRLTAPPVQPLPHEPAPTYRGQMPEEPARTTAGLAAGTRPESNPAYGAASPSPSQPTAQLRWQAVPERPAPMPPSIRLGTPQFAPLSDQSPRPPGTSPVGYPR
jgi:hypothetical protein